jgi:hypothetical protein
VECAPLSLVLAADSTVRVPITLIASEAGDLTLSGIRLRLPDGQEEILLNPGHGTSAQIGKSVSAMKAKHRSGPAVSDIRPDTRRRAADVRDAITLSGGTLDCRVIPAQPLMWIRGTNLNHGSLITMDGET